MTADISCICLLVVSTLVTIESGAKTNLHNIEEVSLHITVTKMAAISRLNAVFILAVCDVTNLQFEFKMGKCIAARQSNSKLQTNVPGTFW